MPLHGIRVRGLGDRSRMRMDPNKAGLRMSFLAWFVGVLSTGYE